MPDATQVDVQNEQQENQDAQGQTSVHPAEFPEAPNHATAGSGGQFDILLDMEVPVTVVLGAVQIPVRRLLQLGPGTVLKLEKSIEASADLYLKDSKFAEADVVVVDNRFGVRIRQITGAGVASNPVEA